MATAATGRPHRSRDRVTGTRSPRIVFVEPASSAKVPLDPIHLAPEGGRLSPPDLPLARQYTPPRGERLLLLKFAPSSETSPPKEKVASATRGTWKYPNGTRETECRLEERRTSV